MLESPSPFVAGAHAKERLRRKWIEKYDNRVPILSSVPSETSAGPSPYLRR